MGNKGCYVLKLDTFLVFRTISIALFISGAKLVGRYILMVGVTRLYVSKTSLKPTQEPCKNNDSNDNYKRWENN